jgi:hypothetical protein
VCGAYLGRMTCHHQNALKFVPEAKYDLIWSAGIFDYLTDRLFTRLVRPLMPFANGGERCWWEISPSSTPAGTTWN